jgi:hypothetical protein
MNKRTSMEQLLENTRAALSSSPNSLGYVKLNKVILPVIRRVMPSVIAQQIVGVQSMNSPFPVSLTRPTIPRPGAWCAKGQWVMFDRSLEPWQREYYDEWCDENVETSFYDEDCYFFDTVDDALMFWLRFG